MSDTDNAPRTAASIIHEASWRVNWTPDDKHPMQARYDALRALMSIHAYSTAVALETLRRIDPAAAERVAEHLSTDDGAMCAENAWLWNQSITDSGSIEPESYVFQKLTGQTTRPQPTVCSLADEPDGGCEYSWRGEACYHLDFGGAK